MKLKSSMLTIALLLVVSTIAAAYTPEAATGQPAGFNLEYALNLAKNYLMQKQQEAAVNNTTQTAPTQQQFSWRDLINLASTLARQPQTNAPVAVPTSTPVATPTATHVGVQQPTGFLAKLQNYLQQYQSGS